MFKGYFLFPITKNLFGKLKTTEKRKKILFLIYKEKWKQPEGSFQFCVFLGLWKHGKNKLFYNFNELAL